MILKKKASSAVNRRTETSSRSQELGFDVLTVIYVYNKTVKDKHGTDFAAANSQVTGRQSFMSFASSCFYKYSLTLRKNNSNNNNQEIPLPGQ